MKKVMDLLDRAMQAAMRAMCWRHKRREPLFSRDAIFLIQGG
jgi:hypothetical protein